jgi:PAS domain S-box-containing protein
MDAAPEILEEAWRRILEEGSYRNLEGRIRKKSGEIATILFSAERIMFKGSPCAIVGIVDITDRRQAEQALQESHRRLNPLWLHSRRIAFHEGVRHLH